MFARLVRRIKALLTTAAAVAIVLGLGIGVYVVNACKLRGIDGERVFYLDSASSQGLRKEELTLRDFSRIQGESVRFDLGDEGEAELVKRLTEEYGARVLFIEEACGVTSYYCYTPKWEGCLELHGQRVNFHVAISDTECAVGTPIIFDGF